MSRRASDRFAELSLGVLLVAAVAGIFIAAEIPTGSLVILALTVAFLFTFRYLYATFYFAMALTPFLGLRVLVSTGDLSIGSRAFGGSIDMSLAEAVLFAVLAAWVVRLLAFWLWRRDHNWEPRLPLAESYLGLFIAHLLSAFSPLLPDPVLVAKFSLRPILFNYLAFIALPANLIRSRRRLVSALVVLSSVGLFAALNGLFAMFFSGAGIGRAHPTPIFGIDALGENHNSLADILVVTVPFTLALLHLLKNPRAKRLLFLGAGFQFLIGLLTLTRTVWIVFFLQLVFLAFTEWREELKKYASAGLVAAVLLLPLAVVMGGYAVSRTAQSSNETRSVLIGIGRNIWASSPWFGGGAGTFVDYVAKTRIFSIEFGEPLDAHGVLQKVTTETGAIGLLAFVILVAQLAWLWHSANRRFSPGDAHRVYLLLVMGAGSGFLYQFLNTDYWNGKMWLPIGISLAAIPILLERQKSDDVVS